jgi:hypothetical protein
LAFVPLHGLPLAGYVRGLVGDLSVTTLALLSMASVSQLINRDLYSKRSFTLLMILALAGGLLLYPLALGLGTFDPYGLGYGSKGFVAVLLAVTLAVAYFDFPLVALCLTAAALGYSLRIYESRNLWDYLIDPLLTLYALFWLTAKATENWRAALDRGP